MYHTFVYTPLRLWPCSSTHDSAVRAFAVFRVARNAPSKSITLLAFWYLEKLSSNSSCDHDNSSHLHLVMASTRCTIFSHTKPCRTAIHLGDHLLLLTPPVHSALQTVLWAPPRSAQFGCGRMVILGLVTGRHPDLNLRV